MESLRSRDTRRRSSASLRCAYCHDAIQDQGLWTCPGCQTRLHEDCRALHGRCTTLACAGALAAPRRAVAPPLADESAAVYAVVIGMFLGGMLGVAAGVSAADTSGGMIALGVLLGPIVGASLGFTAALTARGLRSSFQDLRRLLSDDRP